MLLLFQMVISSTDKPMMSSSMKGEEDEVRFWNERYKNEVTHVAKLQGDLQETLNFSEFSQFHSLESILLITNYEMSASPIGRLSLAVDDYHRVTSSACLKPSQ